MMHSSVKVLHVHTLPLLTGSGINTLITMKGLMSKGYSLEFACAPGGRLVDEARDAGIIFHPIKYLKQEVDIISDIRALFELYRLIRKGKYTIVHTHNSKAGFIGRCAAHMAGVPVVVHTVHGFAFHECEKPPRRFLFILLERFAAGFADAMIAVSTPLKNWGLSIGVGREGQYEVIPDGIEFDKFKAGIDPGKIKKELSIPNGDLVVGVVAKLWEGKGHAVLLEAAVEIARRVPNVRFLLVGDGYLRDSLERMVLNKGLKDYIIFTGFRNDIPEITSVFDVSVLASSFEGLGRVLLEAMALGKPVVGTNIGGIPEAIRDGVNGLLVPAGDAKALSEAIISLLSDGDMRRRMGDAGRKIAQERFSSEKMVSDIEVLYRRLLERKAK